MRDRVRGPGREFEGIDASRQGCSEAGCIATVGLGFDQLEEWSLLCFGIEQGGVHCEAEGAGVFADVRDGQARDGDFGGDDANRLFDCLKDQGQIGGS